MAFLPGVAFRQAIIQKRLNPIDRAGKTGVGRFLGVKFLPERPQLLPLIGGEEGKEFTGGLRFPLMLRLFSFAVIGKGIPGVQPTRSCTSAMRITRFDPRPFPHIPREASPLGEVPGVLRVRFPPGTIRQQRVPVNAFHAITSVRKAI